MRRLARWTLNALTALSLLLWMADGVLWARSYRAADSWTQRTLRTGRAPEGWPTRDERRVALSSGCGVVWLVVRTSSRWDDRPIRERYMSAWSHAPMDPRVRSAMPVPRTFWQRLGFRLERATAGSPRARLRDEWYSAPYWLACAAFAVLPAWRGGGVVRRRLRGRRGLCPGCGYDLRATPDKCPECGRVVEGAAGVAAGG